MKFAARMVCRFLVFSMMMLSFQTVQAGMLGTDQVASATNAQADRNAVLGVISRSEIASQLQAMGLDPKAAKDRIAALTDEEVRTLAGQLDSLPAGADSGWWIAAVIVVGVLIWYMYYRR